MKAILTILTIFSIGILCGCSAETPPNQTAITTQSTGQTIDVTSPTAGSGHINNTPNNGSVGAAKMISPLTP